MLRRIGARIQRPDRHLELRHRKEHRHLDLDLFGDGAEAVHVVWRGTQPQYNDPATWHDQHTELNRRETRLSAEAKQLDLSGTYSHK